MNKYFISIGVLVAALFIGCTSKKNDNHKGDYQKEAMLSGIWIGNEDEAPAFMAKDDTLYYIDSNVMPTHFRIYEDTIYIDGATRLKYVIEKLTKNLFVFRNQNGEQVKLIKTSDPSYKALFRKNTLPIADVNQQMLKRDSVLIAGDTRYHCYVQVNPTTYKVVKNSINNEGVGIGKVYYDNFINVTVYTGNRRIYSHDFKKQEFSNYVPTEIMRQSILSDIVYQKCTSEKVTFQAQLRIPESASSYIVNVDISSTGSVSMSQP